MLPRIGLVFRALSGSRGFCELEPGCGDRSTSTLFNFRNCGPPTCTVCMLHCSQAVERSLSFFQRPARCGAASVTFVTSGNLSTRVFAWKWTWPPWPRYACRKFRLMDLHLTWRTLFSSIMVVDTTFSQYRGAAITPKLKNALTKF